MAIPHYPMRDFFHLSNPYSLPTTDTLGFFDSFYEPNYNSFTGEPNHSKVMDPNKFQLRVDTNLRKDFKAKDINVMVENGFIHVNAKQDERPDENDIISKKFTGRYRLPIDVHPNVTYSTGGFDDTITIKAQRDVQVSSACKKGRIIPLVIEQPQMLHHDLPTDIPQMDQHDRQSFQSYQARLALAKLALEGYREKYSNKFELPINYKMYKPFEAEEVDVRFVDGFVVVSAKHDERPSEHNFISHEFTRRYKLPDDVESDEISSSWSQDGIVTIKAQKKVKVPPPCKEGRIVPIVME